MENKIADLLSKKLANKCSTCEWEGYGFACADCNNGWTLSDEAANEIAKQIMELLKK